MTGKRLVVFFLCFYIVWSIKEWVFVYFPHATLALMVVKIGIWIIPVYFYLKHVDGLDNPFMFLKLKQNLIKGLSWGAMISIVLVIFQLTLIYSFHWKLNFHLGLRWLTTPIFAFPEEVMFRGFILQKISKSVKFLKANLYTSLLFVSIHFPNWLLTGMTLPKWIYSVVTVFIISLFLGYVCKKTNSLWSTTFVHTVYNLLLYSRM